MKVACAPLSLTISQFMRHSEFALSDHIGVGTGGGGSGGQAPNNLIGGGGNIPFAPPHNPPTFSFNFYV